MDLNSTTEPDRAAPPAILLVEDDPGLRVGLAAVLSREGYRAIHAADGERALEVIADRTEQLALVVLDLMLPGIDGIAVLKHLRRHRPELPVLILSAKGAAHDKVTLLDAGADDYMVKPFEVEELLARIRALLKRFQKTETRRFRLGEVQVDLDTRRVTREGQPVRLSAIELAILEALLLRAGAVVSRDDIVARVWDLDPPESSRAVDYHILQLRRKLEPEPGRPAFIVTEPGLGYRVECTPTPP